MICGNATAQLIAGRQPARQRLVKLHSAATCPAVRGAAWRATLLLTAALCCYLPCHRRECCQQTHRISATRSLIVMVYVITATAGLLRDLSGEVLRPEELYMI